MPRFLLFLALAGSLMIASCNDDDDNGNPADTTDPEVTILQPLAGADVPTGDVLIRARATDNSGVEEVEFYVDGAKIGEDATGAGSVYEFTWDAGAETPDCDHTIRVRAIDTSGNDDEASVGVTLIAANPTIHSENIVTDETWAPSGNPHIVTGALAVWEGATLTILPGCLVQFQVGVDGGLGVGWDPSTGALVAVGTAQQPIVFTAQGCDPQPGDWRGLSFFGGTLPATRLSYCTIEYTGYDDGAAVYVGWGGVVRMDHCTIRHAGAKGITYEHAGHVDQFNNNTITDCADYPFETEPEYVRYLGTGNSFTGNAPGKDKIMVYDGVVVTSGTWRNQGVPYEIAVVNAGGGIWISPTAGPAAIVTIEAGTTIRFSPGSQVNIGYGGSTGGLIAVGTALSPITFTSAASNPQPGDWLQIAFEDGSVDAQCRLEHCVIEYCGGGEIGNISIVDALPTISNCSIQNGASYGIFLGGGEYPAPGTLEANNTFNDLAGANVHVEE